MTFQPAKLDSLSDSLDAEVKSAEILLSRLESLASEGDEGDGGAESGKRAERKRRLVMAEGVVRGYVSWLADTSGKLEVEVDGLPEDASERDVSFPPCVSLIPFSFLCISVGCANVY